jgi:hypothetical protein
VSQRRLGGGDVVVRCGLEGSKRTDGEFGPDQDSKTVRTGKNTPKRVNSLILYDIEPQFNDACPWDSTVGDCCGSECGSKEAGGSTGSITRVAW